MLDKTHGLRTSTLSRDWWWCEIRCHIEIRYEIGPCGPCSPFVEKRPWEMASQVALVVKNLPANARDIRDMGSIVGLGRSHGEGNGNPLQYSCLESPMDRGTWRARVYYSFLKPIQNLYDWKNNALVCISRSLAPEGNPTDCWLCCWNPRLIHQTMGFPCLSYFQSY